MVFVEDSKEDTYLYFFDKPEENKLQKLDIKLKSFIPNSNSSSIRKFLIVASEGNVLRFDHG